MANITKAERERRAKEAAENARAKLAPEPSEPIEVQITEQSGDYCAPEVIGEWPGFPTTNSEVELNPTGATMYPTTDQPQEWATKRPTCPIKSDPTMGDKDPAIVAWWFDNFPEIAARKYKDRIVTRL